MNGKIWCFLATAFLIAPFSAAAKADNDQTSDNLLINYHQFVQAFETKNKEQLKTFLDGQSKIGQEIGGSVSALLEYTGQDGNCYERLLNALYAGCKKTAENGLGCIAPPAADDNSILYAGPSIAFVADSTGNSFKLQFVACGSD